MKNLSRTFTRPLLFCVCCVPLLFVSVVSGQQSPADRAAPQSDELPLSARYFILFRRLAGSPEKKQTPETTVESRRIPPYREMFQRETKLSDEESLALNRIAADCMRQVAEVDKRAREIITAYRAQNPPRRLAPGEQVPPSPPELKSLQEERNQIILNAREQVRAAFGDAEFRRFDEYVATKGGGRTFTMPTPNSSFLPVQMTITALDADGITAKRQFHAGARILIQIVMTNNSAQSIAVKQSELYEWLQLIRITKDEADEELTLLPPHIFRHENNKAAVNIPATELPIGQQTIVGVIDLSASFKQLQTGQYKLEPRPRVLLNRPPDKSAFLRLTVGDSDSVTFEIVP